MDQATRDKLGELKDLHEKRIQAQGKEDALAAELAASGERGVRTEMAKILGVTVEALRLRYGSVKPAVDVVRAEG